MRWVTYEPKGEMLVLDKIFPNGIRICDYFFDRNVIHLPNDQDSYLYGLHLCNEECIRCSLDKSRHYCHSQIHETFADPVRIQKEIQAGTIAIADGTTAGSGPGPRTMTPIVKNVLDSF